MIYIRQNHDRGRSQIQWLDSLHTFSFADYHDPKFKGYGSLRVINEDTIQPGFGFAKHPHHNMEIISYVVEGTLEHRDSLGNSSIIKPGEIQIMSSGAGVEHSEYNHLKSDLLHFLQIWIIPKEIDLPPSYQQKTIRQEKNKWILIGSNDEHEGSVKINQNINVYAAHLTYEQSINYLFKNNRMNWLQLIKGKIKLNDYELSAGDGAAIQNENISIHCIQDAELLLFDLGIN